jgi:hypothetical protein
LEEAAGNSSIKVMKSCNFMQLLRNVHKSLV